MIKIKYHNINYDKDVILPYNIEEFNSKIDYICKSSQFFKIIENNGLLKKTIKITNQFSKNKKHFLVFGTGGSNLGARAIINAINKKLKKNIEFYDNIDPVNFEKSMENINFSSTGFIFISKSGSTAETLCQLGVIIELARKKNLIKNFFLNTLVITEFKKSPLYNLAKKYNISLIEHDKDIGGRYSIFSNVAMVPSIIAGLNVKNIHKGAEDLIKNKKKFNLYDIGKIFRFQNKTNYSMNVLMTYSDSLYFFGKWYLQLWAESIGKNTKGITPIHSIGTVDQHSQLQLYLDGPKDKFFTFITTNHSKKGLKINNNIIQTERLKYLHKKKMGDLMQAEQQATIDTFKKNNLKFRNIHIPHIDEYSIGSMFALSIVETIATCLYFKVNPFDQPAVEQGKKLTKKYLLR